MRPARYTVTSSNSPMTIPLNWMAGLASIIATPNGSGNYDVAYTNVDITDTTITPNWIDITDMSAATAQVGDKTLTSVTALRITLNSGTNVIVDLASADT